MIIFEIREIKKYFMFEKENLSADFSSSIVTFFEAIPLCIIMTLVKSSIVAKKESISSANAYFKKHNV